MHSAARLPRSLSRSANEDGFTVLELIIVTALLGVVMSLVGAGLVNMTRVTRSTDDRSRADTELRQAIEAMARDIRAANPIDVQNPVTLYDTQIAFAKFCETPGGTCGADNLRQIVYRVTANKLELSEGGGAFRAILEPSPTSQLPIGERQFSLVNLASEPVFTYLKADGTALETGGATPSPAERFRDCTRAVRIYLRMISEPGNTRAPVDLTTTVTLRNFNEVSAC